MNRWLFWVAYEWLLIAAAMLVASHEPLLWPLAVLFIGTRQHALAVLGHEVVHRTFGHHDRLGSLLCMWPVLADVEGFRRFHIKHHKCVGTNLDPERQVRLRFIERWVGLTKGTKIRLIVGDLLGLHIDEAFHVMKWTRGAWTWQRSIYCVGFAGLVVFSLGWIAFLAWMVALVTANFASMRLRMWREHLGAEVTDVYEAKWWERFLYLPHHIWRHEPHHRKGCWSTPAWELHKL